MLKTQAEKLKEGRRQKYLDDCKSRLSKIAKTKMETTFIGALNSIENTFGFLWGIDKTEENRTDEELEFYELWQELRTEILNNGNAQYRGLALEISNHVIMWNRYNTTFKIVNSK